MASVLAKIERAKGLLGEAVAEIEADAVAGADAEVLVRSLSAVAKIADGGVAKLARRLEETARWRAAGTPSPEAFLGALTGGSMADGRRLLDTSNRLTDLEATRGAMERGELSVEQAAQIATAAGELADAGRHGEAATAERDLLVVAGRGNFGSLRTAAEQARQAARDEAAQAAHLRKTRFFRKRRFDDDGVGGTFKLEPGVAAEVYAVLDAEAERQFRLARSEGRREGARMLCPAKPVTGPWGRCAGVAIRRSHGPRRPSRSGPAASGRCSNEEPAGGSTRSCTTRPDLTAEGRDRRAIGGMTGSAAPAGAVDASAASAASASSSSSDRSSASGTAAR